MLVYGLLHTEEQDHENKIYQKCSEYERINCKVFNCKYFNLNSIKSLYTYLPKHIFNFNKNSEFINSYKFNFFFWNYCLKIVNLYNVMFVVVCDKLFTINW